MDTIVTDKRTWTRSDVAELLISRTALTELKMDHALQIGVLDGKPRSATVTAVSDMDIAVLDRPALTRLIDTVPNVACALMGP